MKLTATLKSIAALATVGALTLGLAACSSSASSSSSSSKSLGTLKVGATAVPAGDIVKFIANGQAKKVGLTIDYTEFSDYVTPDTALSEGSIDVNLFQHGPYLTNFNTENGTDLVNVGEVYLPPLALYSKKVTSVKEIKTGDTIAVPNDPTNEGRALALLASAGLISVKDKATTAAGITDLKGHKVVELDAASLPGSLDDSKVTAAIVNLSFALPAGLTGDQQILAEGTDSPYYNILATNQKLKNDPRVKEFYALLTSPETKKFIEDTYKGLVIPVK